MTKPADDLRGRIESHVEFLSQARLGGRKPGTAGSRFARRYIEARFREYGLAPWGKAPGYVESFGYGKNIVGFLPGSDPKLADQIVLLCAHYDHLGKNQKGRICPGAADNASGVGALLEVARQLNADPMKPKRSVLFACFDCEEMMLFGSFAFTCKKEVRAAKIVAVVNVDMLGRNLLDVVRHTLFIAGSERYPATREQIIAAGVQAGIRILPLGTDLVGPRSDHVAFQARGVPCLFFSCGTFRDYHEPEDTADKLNYEDIARSSAVIGGTIRELANSLAIEQAEPAQAGFASELRSVRTVVSEVSANRSQAGIRKDDAEAFSKLTAEAQELSASNRYDYRARKKPMLDAGGILAPYFLPVDMLGKAQTPEERQEMKLLLQYLQQFYLDYGPRVLEGYRQLVEQLLKYRPGLTRGMPLFYFELYDIPDEAISIRSTQEDKVALNALGNFYSMAAQVKASKWLVPTFQANITLTIDPLDCEGTRQQVADYCLLRLRGVKNYPKRFATIKKVFNSAQQSDCAGGYNDLLSPRLKEGAYRDETDWIISCIQSGCDSLALEALDAVRTNRDQRVVDAVCRVMADPLSPSGLRAAAIQLVPGLRSARACLVLCDLLNDSTPARPADLPQARDDYPFSDLISVKEATHVFEKERKKMKSQTLADLAHVELKKAAQKDLGTDPSRWRDWVQRHLTR